MRALANSGCGALELAEELKDLTEAKYRVGAAAEVDVVQTEADIANREDQLITSKNNVKQAKDRLRILIFNLTEMQEPGCSFRRTGGEEIGPAPAIFIPRTPTGLENDP